MAKHAAIVMSRNKIRGDKGEKGVILFVSSTLGEAGMKGNLAYSASKAALDGMLMPMARDLGKYGIRVLAIQPGMFETPMT